MEKLWHETKQPTRREQRNDKYSNTEISKNSQTFLTKITRKTVLLYQTIILIYFLENMYWMSQVYWWKRVYLPIYISALVQKILKVALCQMLDLFSFEECQKDQDWKALIIRPIGIQPRDLYLIGKCVVIVGIRLWSYTIEGTLSSFVIFVCS